MQIFRFADAALTGSFNFNQAIKRKKVFVSYKDFFSDYNFDSISQVPASKASAHLHIEKSAHQLGFRIPSPSQITLKFFKLIPLSQ